MSVKSVERHDDHMTERGVTTWVQPKLLQQSPPIFEGNVEALPDRLGGANPCHATGMSQASGPGKRS